MNPRLRFWLACALGVGLGLIVAFGIAEESYLVAGLLAVVIAWLVAEWIHGPLPDAWALAAVLIGYLLGNRGFAQLFLLPNFPLLPAEAALLVCAPMLVLRMAFKQSAALTRDGLNYAIFAWMLYGVARLPLDFRHYGFNALRDFATVYYASFFFIAQALCRHEASRALLRQALTAAFALLPAVSLAFTLFPVFFLTIFTWRGVPLIYHKDDLIATFLGGGFFYFWAQREAGKNRGWLLLAAICLLMSPSLNSPRAAMVGIAAVTVVWLLARRPRLLAFQAGVITLALLAATPVFLLRNRDLRETKAYSVYEHAVSIFDFQGRGSYLHAESGDPGDNNRFRLVWWRSVALETLEQSPVFGLGFGADLAARFLNSYELADADEFTARSPHSVVMTVFGRMGALGLLLFLAIALMMARTAWPAFRRWDFPAMGLWSVVGVLGLSACFGVVLEGPMGAVLFWTVLGMAHDAGRPAEAPELAAAPAALQPAEQVGETAAPL